jgi:Stage II sporulation protein E (SpoIIE)
MARRLGHGLLVSAMFAYAIFVFAQTTAGKPGSTEPRRLDASESVTRITLGPDWLFSAGDNPAYASPAYDDSAWQTISAEKTLASYGIHDIPYAWYRIHVHLPPGARHLALAVQLISGSYEVYANGVRIGADGRMSGLREFAHSDLVPYDIPDSVLAADGDLLIAFRFALKQRPGREDTSLTPFSTDSIEISPRDVALHDAGDAMAHRNAVQFMICGLNLLVGMVALALYLAMRSQVEYLAIAISLLAASLQAAAIIWMHFHGLTPALDFLEQAALGVVNVALIEFVRLILHLKQTRWLLALEIANFLGYMTTTPADLGFMSVAANVYGYFIPALAVKAVLLVLLVRGLRGGNRDARVILPAIAIVSLGDVWFALQSAKFLLHVPLIVPAMPYMHLGSYGMDFWNMWQVIYCVTILLFLVLRTIGIAHERARIAGELEAARTVQHVLIPDEIPSVPGFVLESVYRPAGEVGGDFFQIVPIKNGGVLVVIGDVSGKGMPAAMTVSLLVGTFRTLAHYTQRPGEILAAMNTRMLSRSRGGFTTCLVLRAEADGEVTIANAGHISPCVAGKELTVENGLPLGLSADATYAESTFHLAPGEQLTLQTDGVIEARDKSGALFGFERATAISAQPAETIAQAAQDFGQDDDITVLTLSYAGVPASA